VFIAWVSSVAGSLARVHCRRYAAPRCVATLDGVVFRIAEQRIPRFDADEPKLAAAELEETHIRRSAIAAETLRHAAAE
jgi:hypothetical protein